MNSFSTWLTGGVLGILLCFLVVRGVMPALSRIDTDFPNYYTAGSIVLHGGDVSKLYNDAWFQERIFAEGIVQQGKFGPYPPLTALLAAPLALTDPLTALRLLTLLSLAAMGMAVVLLRRILQVGWEYAALLVLVSGTGLVNCFRFGQVYILISTMMVAGYYFYLRRKPILAGLCFGFWIPVKYFPVVFLISFLLQKEWRLVISAVGSAALMAGVGVVVLGWEIHRQFLQGVLGNHLAGQLSLQSPYSPAFQSFESLYRTLFIHDVQRNPHPILPSEFLYTLLLVLTICLVLGTAVYTLSRVRSQDFQGRASLPVLGTVALLLAPATATYHGVLLWLPAGLALAWPTGERHRPAMLILGLLYAVIGFIPYGTLLGFAGRGMLTLLAYPRLFLLLGFYGLLVFRTLRLYGDSAHDSPGERQGDNLALQTSPGDYGNWRVDRGKVSLRNP